MAVLLIAYREKRLSIFSPNQPISCDWSGYNVCQREISGEKNHKLFFSVCCYRSNNVLFETGVSKLIQPLSVMSFLSARTFSTPLGALCFAACVLRDYRGRRMCMALLLGRAARMKMALSRKNASHFTGLKWDAKNVKNHQFNKLHAILIHSSCTMDSGIWYPWVKISLNNPGPGTLSN